MRRATRLKYVTIFFMLTIIVAIYFTMGGSQAMRTAWYEDILGLVPAFAFLIARHFEKRLPDDAFPMGYYKATAIAYLVAATALVLLALYMSYESSMALLALEHPTIGLVSVFGYDFWMGWAMIAALVYSIIPPVILGRMKEPLARKLHDPVLMADASMQKADWMTAAAAIAGIVGVGFGLWWADAVAAMAIALDVMNDGRKHIVRTISDLADHAPRKLMAKEPDPTDDRVRRAVLEIEDVEAVELQLRTEGHVITGTLFLRLRSGSLRPEVAERVRRAAIDADWRLYDPDVSILP